MVLHYEEEGHVVIPTADREITGEISNIVEKEALIEEEYNAARGTVLNAHYTSPVVIKAMYECIENMGFRTGNVLEPSMGVGNFFGLLPESMGRYHSQLPKREKQPRDSFT